MFCLLAHKSVPFPLHVGAYTQIILQFCKIALILWLDDVESDLKKVKVKGWKEKMRNGEEWRLVVEQAKAHPGL
jgi:hypothetical protein